MPEWIVPAISGLLAFAGAWGGINVHLRYLRRDVDHATRSARKAHWRLDSIQAPPAPLDSDK
jgi:hypothetical protein